MAPSDLGLNSFTYKQVKFNSTNELKTNYKMDRQLYSNLEDYLDRIFRAGQSDCPW